MSVETKTVIRCDATMCAEHRIMSAPSITRSRAMLKTQGWSRRHHGDRLVDLCPSHKDYATDDSHCGGRPRKQ